MQPETMFKLAFVVAFMVTAIAGARAAKRSARRHGAPVNQIQNEVKGLIAIRAALGIVFYAALFTWLFRSDLLRWMYVPLSQATRIAGVLLFVPVLFLMISSYAALGTNYRGGVGLYDEHELVTTGPYRFMRHPIYAGFVLMMLLVGLVSANWVISLSGLLLVSLIPALRIPVEEAELRERFGETWTTYSDRTSKWWPRFL